MALDLMREKDLYRLIEAHMLDYARQIRYELLEELIESLRHATLRKGVRVLDVGDVCEWLQLRMDKEKGP